MIPSQCHASRHAQGVCLYLKITVQVGQLLILFVVQPVQTRPAQHRVLKEKFKIDAAFLMAEAGRPDAGE